jgi:hypothetical protein
LPGERLIAAHVPETEYVPFVFGERKTVFGQRPCQDMHMLPVDGLYGRMPF